MDDRIGRETEIEPQSGKRHAAGQAMNGERRWRDGRSQEPSRSDPVTASCSARAAARTRGENLVWAAKEVNQRKADRLPLEAGLKLLSVPRASSELPVSAVIRNAHGIPDWEPFAKE